MDRWMFLSEQAPIVNERVLTQQSGIRLYDGDSKMNVEDVSMEVTSHRLMVRNLNMVLDLVRVQSVAQEESFLRSDKISIKLFPLGPSEAAMDRPYRKEKAHMIKLAFKSGGLAEFHQTLNKAVEARAWTVVAKAPAKREIRAGIAGIEKKMSARARQDDANISKAFEDLNKLIEMAKPMVKLAQSISTKVRDTFLYVNWQVRGFHSRYVRSREPSQRTRLCSLSHICSAWA